MLAHCVVYGGEMASDIVHRIYDHACCQNSTCSSGSVQKPIITNDPSGKIMGEEISHVSDPGQKVNYQNMEHTEKNEPIQACSINPHA